SEPTGYRVDLVTFERTEAGAIVYDDVTRRPREVVLTQSVATPIAEVVRSGTTVDPVTGATVRTGMRDDRRNEDLDLVVVNVANLRSAVEADHGTSEAFGNDPSQQPASWWNGIVYVELPYATATTRADGV